MSARETCRCKRGGTSFRFGPASFLARSGLRGTPMGTRAIAEHLNALGYRNHGRPFFHSSVDGILTRPHHGGHYLNPTADSKGQKPSIEESIVVSRPQIVSPKP
ncbi:recombinase family protein [Sphingomonas sp. MJ1 (PH-R8)]|uniref:recombinase family protein n=1 Tax=Sphingomonas sp. MJ1 (PH-R8) TaxID=3112950 RepID=UPI003A872D60